MRSLLDSNLLIALLDGDHNFHSQAFAWFESHHAKGWASCALTENAVLRIIPYSNYSINRRFNLPSLAPGLSRLIDHTFWPCDLSITDTTRFPQDQILGPKQLTGVYLLGLAAINGKLVTFDSRISITAVIGAAKHNLEIL